MEKATNYLTGFLTGISSIFMALIPLTVLWFVLSGNEMLGMNVIENFTTIITYFGNGGFVGLVGLLFVMSFFVKK
jgi:hypothetical protein